MINGFTISKTKTQRVHFCQPRIHNNPTLKLDGSEIPVVNQYKFLGVIFDKKLSCIPHIQYLKDKCNKTLKLLRIIAHKDRIIKLGLRYYCKLKSLPTNPAHDFIFLP